MKKVEAATFVRFEFSSVTDLVTECKKILRNSSMSWSNENSLDHTYQKSLNGDLSAVPSAEKILEKLLSDIAISRQDWQNDIAGVMPDVPAFLAGMPENMRARVQRPTNNSDIRVFINMATSSMVKPEQVLKRGIVTLALVLQLQKFRQVELFIYGVNNSEKDICSVVKVQSNPIQLSEAAYVLTSSSFRRRLTLDFEGHHGGRMGWPKVSEKVMLDAGVNDLVVPAMNGHNNTELQEMLADPIKWVNKIVSKFTTELEEAY